MRFAYIGGLAPQKGIHVLVEAFNDLDRDATLEIYGDPTRFPDYSHRLRTMAHSPQIVFGGWLDRDGVWRVLSEIDASDSALIVVRERTSGHTGGIRCRSAHNNIIPGGTGRVGAGWHGWPAGAARRCGRLARCLATVRG